MQTEDLLRFDAELRAIRQALQVTQLEAVFPATFPAIRIESRPSEPPQPTVREGRTPFVSCSQGQRVRGRLAG